MLATEIIIAFLITKEIFPIISNLGKSHDWKNVFLPQQSNHSSKAFGPYGRL